MGVFSPIPTILRLLPGHLHQRLQDPACSPKNEFRKQTIPFLGYEVDKDGIRPPKARIDAIQNLKQPRDKKELVRYIGMFGFYQRCIPNYAEFVEPLTEVQRSPTFVWKEHHTKALENLKKSLVNATRLAFPNHRGHVNICLLYTSPSPRD